jgi:DNA-binding response OmpR family regulator
MDCEVLVVDDDEEIREVLEIGLGRAGYTVNCAQSAEEAQDILKRENIQVMFLDLVLPGMNGVDFFKQIRRHKPIAVIYALTGHASLFELEDCRQAGFDDYFVKPVKLKVLCKAAEDAFEKINRWKKL